MDAGSLPLRIGAISGSVFSVCAGGEKTAPTTGAAALGKSFRGLSCCRVSKCDLLE